jgi:hypothetical protein
VSAQAPVGGYTLEQLAASAGCGVEFMAEVLAGEGRRGRVERSPQGTYRATPAAVSDYGEAFTTFDLIDRFPRPRGTT